MKTLEEFEFEITPDDIGEIISIIRIQHLKMHARPFADKLGVQEKLLLTTEEGRGPHGLMLLKKINETFRNIEISMSVKLKG